MAYSRHYGYASPNPVAPTLPWIFRKISTHEKVVHHYTHGMGYGDVDGDGRNDLLDRGWMVATTRLPAKRSGLGFSPLPIR